MRFWPLTTGSPCNRNDIALRYGENANTLPLRQFFLEVEPDSLPDIAHQLVERLSLGKYIDPDAATAPVFSIRIYLKCNKHGSFSVVGLIVIVSNPKNNAFMDDGSGLFHQPGAKVINIGGRIGEES
jgi:hypothetical protein